MIASGLKVSGDETMRLDVDAKADVLYLSLKEGKQSHTKQVAPGIILRYGLDGQVLEVVVDLPKHG